jgi:hypothetical protein
MRQFRSPLALIPMIFCAGLALSACTGMNMPGFGPSADAPPPAPAEVPSRYTPEEFVGRWGLASYHREADRARTEAAARSQCRQPYVIAKGPGGGIMMHLADQREPTELRLKGSPDGKNYIGLPGEPAGSPQDREIISFDGRVLITRFVDPDAARRFGYMVYVRCGPRA